MSSKQQIVDKIIYKLNGIHFNESFNHIDMSELISWAKEYEALKKQEVEQENTLAGWLYNSLLTNEDYGMINMINTVFSNNPGLEDWFDKQKVSRKLQKEKEIEQALSKLTPREKELLRL